MRERFQRIVSEWTKNLTKEEAVVKVFQRVRDIPYGVIGSRDPVKVLEENKGTCSGKHLLLAALYRTMGLNVKDMVAFHKYETLPRNVEYPEELKVILKKGDGIPDYHNFIKLYVNGNWLTLDATFEENLKEYFVVNYWNGKHDTKLSVKPIAIWEVRNPVEFKVTKLNKLPSQIQTYRKQFLERLSEWLDCLRKKETLG
jgi:transglutaminase-like putative cysteine protease